MKENQKAAREDRQNPEDAKPPGMASICFWKYIFFGVRT